MTKDPTGSVRKPALDKEADGLDCFATEGVSAIDSADDAAAAVEAQMPLGVPEKALDVWRRGARGEYAKASVVGVSILAVAVLALQIIKQPAEQVNGLSEVQAPRAPAAPPTVSAAPQPIVRPEPAPAPVPAPVVESSTRAQTATAIPRTAPTVAPSPRTPAPRIARVPDATLSADTARSVVPSSPAIESPVVVATPEVVRAVPEAEVARAAAAPAVIVPPSDRVSIERVLEAYREAYDRLDAPSAAVIWPRVDTRALSRAFSTLAEQDLSFDSCDLDIAGARAKARCVGEIRYVRRVGDQEPRVRRLSWSFALERVSDRWQIAQVTAD